MGGRQAVSSTPQACGLTFRHPRWRRVVNVGRTSEALSAGRETFKFVSQVSEVVLADAQAEHFFDHRKEVSQRSNQVQRGRVSRPHQTTRCCQDQSVFDYAHGQTAVIELFGEQAVWPANDSYCSRRFAIGFQNPLNISLSGGCRRPRFSPQPCGSRSDGPSMTTVWQKCLKRLRSASTIGRLPKKFGHSS